MTESLDNITIGARFRQGIDEYYSVESKNLADRLARALEEDSVKGTLELGPSEQMLSSGGEDLTLISIGFDISSRRSRAKEWHILAFDSQGCLVGNRELTVMTDGNDLAKVTNASGSISTGLRNKGVATCLVRTTAKLIQLEANQIQEPINWTVENGNLETLEALKKWHAHDPDYQQRVEEKELEQQRWQRLYGSGGMLGFDEEGVKVIQPNRSEDSPTPQKASPEQRQKVESLVELLQKQFS